MANFVPYDDGKPYEGRVYSGLTTIRKATREDLPASMITKIIYWLCKCECGNEVLVVEADLILRMTVSCGCYDYIDAEDEVEAILKSNKIKYKRAFQPDEFRVLGYRFDFYLPKEKAVIEFYDKAYQGIASGFYSEDAVYNILIRKATKEKYLRNNKIKLYQIPFLYRDSLTVELLFDEYFLKNTEDSSSLESIERLGLRKTEETEK